MAQNRDISQLQIGMHNSYCILYREHVSGEAIVRMLYSCSPAVACPVATLVVHCSYTGSRQWLVHIYSIYVTLERRPRRARGSYRIQDCYPHTGKRTRLVNESSTSLVRFPVQSDTVSYRLFGSYREAKGSYRIRASCALQCSSLTHVSEVAPLPTMWSSTPVCQQTGKQIQICTTPVRSDTHSASGTQSKLFTIILTIYALITGERTEDDRAQLLRCYAAARVARSFCRLPRAMDHSR